MSAKRLLDVSLSGAGLIVSSPLWAIVAAAIKLESSGPVFFTQVRVGEGGRHFDAIKFRSMVEDAETGLAGEPPRTTRV
jgi:lipopolysaccharide/colanic/teichoic acid biosynthesis glycosyltransferase